MGLPSQEVTLTVEQIGELNATLSNMRHDVNNSLSVMVAAVELIRHKPHTAQAMLARLVEQPPKVNGSINKFSAEFERAFGITRP